VIPDISSVNPTLPSGEKADPKTIAAKVQGMFLEMMIKTMEESVQAEEGLFGSSSSSEIYRGLLREQLGAAMAHQLRTPFERQLEQGIQKQMPQDKPPEISEAHEEMLPVDGRISSTVGWRRDPINGEMRFHKGTDIAAAQGTDVRAVADGVVIESGVRGGYGNTVVVQANDGRRMLYGHNHANLVRTGDRIRRGEVIAQVGATGRATGPHVHFEVMEP